VADDGKARPHESRPAHGRASGVSCTPWLDGPGHDTTAPIRPARPAALRTRGHGTRGHAPPWSGLTGHGTRGHAPPSSGLARPRTRVPPTGRARRAVIRAGTTGRSPTGRHPSGPQRAAPQRAVIPAGTPRASVGSAPAMCSSPTGCGGAA